MPDIRSLERELRDANIRIEAATRQLNRAQSTYDHEVAQRNLIQQELSEAKAALNL